MKLFRIPHLPNYLISRVGNIFYQGKEIQFPDFQKQIAPFKVNNIEFLLAITFGKFKLEPFHWEDCEGFRTGDDLLPYMVRIKRPILIDEKLGLYFVPYFPKVGITKDGKVYDLLNLKVLKEHPVFDYVENKPSYSQIFNCVCDLVSSKTGKSQKHALLHRLIALAFVPYCGDFRSLDINHKDANRRNNCPTNLEWVSRTQNLVHAFENGLRTDNIPVKVRDIKTGVVRDFYSASSAGRFFNCGNDAIMNRVRRGSGYCYHGFQFKHRDDDTDWHQHPKEVSNYQRNFEVTRGKETFIVKGRAEIRKYISVSFTTFNKHLLKNNGLYIDKNGSVIRELVKSHVSGTTRWNPLNCGKLLREYKRNEDSVNRYILKRKERKRLISKSNKTIRSEASSSVRKNVQRLSRGGEYTQVSGSGGHPILEREG